MSPEQANAELESPGGPTYRPGPRSPWVPRTGPRTSAFLAAVCGLVGALVAGGAFWALMALLLFSAFARGGASSGWATWVWGALVPLPFVGAVASGLWCGFWGYIVLGGEVKSRSRRGYRIMGTSALGMLAGSIVALLVPDMPGEVGYIAPPLCVYAGLISGGFLGVKASARDGGRVEGD